MLFNKLPFEVHFYNCLKEHEDKIPCLPCESFCEISINTIHSVLTVGSNEKGDYKQVGEIFNKIKEHYAVISLMF